MEASKCTNDRASEITRGRAARDDDRPWLVQRRIIAAGSCRTCHGINTLIAASVVGVECVALEQGSSLMAKVVPRYRVFAVSYRLLDEFALAGIGEEEFQRGWKWQIDERNRDDGKCRAVYLERPERELCRCEAFLIKIQRYPRVSMNLNLVNNCNRGVVYSESDVSPFPVTRILCEQPRHR